MVKDGFFVLTGHSITEQEIARQVDIAYVSAYQHCASNFMLLIETQTVLEATSKEEKEAMQGHMDVDGVYRGFKLRQYYE